MNKETRICVGLDWADQKHDVMVLLPGDSAPEHRVIQSKPESIEQWACSLHQEHPDARIAICLEQSRGPVVYGLIKFDFIDLYPVNPAMLKKYRDAFYGSGVKDDPKDAGLLLDLLLTHPERLMLLEPQEEHVRQLQLYCETRRELVDMRSKLMNRLRTTLKRYYPQALLFCGNDLSSVLACDFLMKWPRFDLLAKSSSVTIRRFLYSHNSRSETLLEQRLKMIEESCPLTTDEAIITPSVMMVCAIVNQIRLVNKSVARFEAAIRELFSSMEDKTLFTELPGAGDALAPRLLVAFGTDRNRWNSANEIQTFTGVAPVTEASGRKSVTHWRWHCPKFLRQSIVEFAAKSIGQSQWARLYYEEQKKRGKLHHAAVRALAFKWMRIVYKCWKTCEPYDPKKYNAALIASGSWLGEKLKQTT